MANSKVDICNMALSNIGNAGSVSNIDTPSTDKEITFAIWYDVVRKALLKLTMPNFALDNVIVSQRNIPSAFGYAYAYEYPSYCLRLLGIGDISERENNYIRRGNSIWTDEVSTTGMNCRIIRDVTDVNSMDPDWQILFSEALAEKVALPITQDVQKALKLKQMMPSSMSEVAGMNAQENRPVRINRSQYDLARFANYVGNRTKK